jgi:hypothetical protein
MARIGFTQRRQHGNCTAGSRTRWTMPRPGRLWNILSKPIASSARGTDSATLQLCRDALESSGFAADAVDSGIAAVVAARESPPDLVLVDVRFATFLETRRSDGSDLTAQERTALPASRRTLPVLIGRI